MSLTFDDDSDEELSVKCDTKKLGTVWFKMTGQSDMKSTSPFSKKFAEAALAEDVDLVSISTVYGEDCAPPPPMAPPQPAPVDQLPEGPIILSFTVGQDQTLDLTGNGEVDFEKFEIVSSDLGTDFNQFVKIDGKDLKVAMPTQYRKW